MKSKAVLGRAECARGLLLVAWGAGSVALCAPGCAATGPGDAPIASADEALRNSDSFAHPEIMAAGTLRTPGGGSFCTATLVAPGIAITAAHCLLGAWPRERLFGCNGSVVGQGWVAPTNPIDFHTTDSAGVSSAAWRVDAASILADAYPQVLDPSTGQPVCANVPVPASGSVCGLGQAACARLADSTCDPWPSWLQDIRSAQRDVALLRLRPSGVGQLAGAPGSAIPAPIPAIVRPNGRRLPRYLVADPAGATSSLAAMLPLQVTQIGYGMGSSGRGVGTTYAAGVNPGRGQSTPFGRQAAVPPDVNDCVARFNLAGERVDDLGVFSTLDATCVTLQARDVIGASSLGSFNGAGARIPGWQVSGPDAGTDVWGMPGDSGGPILFGAFPLPVQVPGRFVTPATAIAALPAPGYALGAVYSGGGERIDQDAGVFTYAGGSAAATFSPAVSDWLIAMLTDTDGDGVPDATDRFDGTDDLGTDSDADGHPDVVDLCPCDPMEQNPWTDGDKDGVCGFCRPSLKDVRATSATFCGDTCKVQVADNCSSAWNPDQKNANRPSELVQNAMELGDACEPVPVPLMKTASYTRAAKKLTGANVERTPITTTESFVNTLTVELMPPRDAMGVARPVTVPTTQVRYCRTSRTSTFRVDCFIDSEALGDRYLAQDKNFNSVTTRAAENSNTWWHRMTTSAGAAAGAPIGSRVYGNAATNASTSTDVTWNWQADYAYWVTRPYGAGFFTPSAVVGKNPGVPTNVADVPEDREYGRFWSHADTRVGMSGSSGIDVAGYHALKNGVAPAQELANGYEALQPYVRTSELGSPKLWTVDWTFPVYSCAPVDCPVYTQPTLDNCPMCGVTNRLPTTSTPIFTGLAAGTALRGLTGGTDAHLGALAQLPGGGMVSGEAGSSLAVSLSRSPSLVHAFAADVRWVGEHDSMAVAGVGMFMPTAIAMRGAAIEEAAFVSGPRLVSATDLVADASAERTARAVAEHLLAASEMPTPRTNAELVYHRGTGRLHVVGGTLANGREAGDVLTFDLRTGAWSTFTPRVALGTVRAASVSADGRTLWLAQEHGRTASLVRLDLTTGFESVVASGTARRAFAKLWLRADGMNGVVVAASTATAAQAFRVSSNASGTIIVTKLGALSNAVDAAPVVEDGSVRFLRRDAASSVPATTRLRVADGARSTTGALAALF